LLSSKKRSLMQSRIICLEIGEAASENPTTNARSQRIFITLGMPQEKEYISRRASEVKRSWSLPAKQR